MKNKILLLALLVSTCATTLAGCGTKMDAAVDNITDGAPVVTENTDDENETNPDGEKDCPDKDGHCDKKRPRVIFKRRGCSAIGFYSGENGNFFFINFGDGGFEEIPLPDDDYRVRPPKAPTVPQ
ncbi:MAG: hypothetical protein K2K80_02695, partial [Clostridia bacterium]|nr:hypothetical protein [Clostridia bacterium]